MSDNRHFDSLVSSGQPIGEVVAVNRFLVWANGLQPINTHALVLFEDGSKGFVHHVLETGVLILHLGSKPVSIGTKVVLQHNELVTRVGEEYIGRIISVSGDPLDDAGPIAAGAARPVFANAPALFKREILNRQLETGVILIDTLFPLVRGQRMTLMGDSKSGKTTLALQLALNQRKTDVIVIYVLIAKRRSDIDALVNSLRDKDALKTAIVVVATMSESPVVNYLAPYVGCALGEFLWQEKNRDVLVIYDDLTSHAQIYREISLLAGVSPGRDSYPGDMFYAHSSLLERAGQLSENHRALTAVPIVFTPGGDITSYLATNVMSITDGQWILDMNIFRDTVRPAINTGLSVTRVGGRGQNSRQKDQAVGILKILSTYGQARQFAHFGSEMALNSQADLARGKQLYDLMGQKPEETFSLMEQQIMLDILMNLKPEESIDLNVLKSKTLELSVGIKEDKDFDRIRDQVKALATVSAVVKRPAEPAVTPSTAPTTTTKEPIKS